MKVTLPGLKKNINLNLKMIDSSIISSVQNGNYNSAEGKHACNDILTETEISVLIDVGKCT